jgi:hypothetical protein
MNTDHEHAGDGKAPAYLKPRQLAEQHAVDVDSLHNWRTRGVVVGGFRVYLDMVRVGRHWRVKREDWERFLAECNPEPPDAPPRRRSESAQEARAAREEEALRKRLNRTGKRGGSRLRPRG